MLLSVAEEQGVIEPKRQTYNHEHPHSRFGFKRPQEHVRFLSALGRVRATPSLAGVLKQVEITSDVYRYRFEDFASRNTVYPPMSRGLASQRNNSNSAVD